MSRCFPYLPPGYCENGATDALIESIKLQKENDKAKAKRKREKREKKEKKREDKIKRKDKKKLKSQNDPNEQQQNDPNEHQPNEHQQIDPNEHQQNDPNEHQLNDPNEHQQHDSHKVLQKAAEFDGKKLEDKNKRKDKKKLKSQNDPSESQQHDSYKVSLNDPIEHQLNDPNEHQLNDPNEHLQHDSHKVLQKAAEFTEFDSKKSERKTEHLERSDVTEEHGQPCSSSKPSYSSDSTQSSNKRKLDDVSLSEVAIGQGKPFKIRLLKKQNGSDSSEDTNRLSAPFVSDNVNETLVSQNRTCISMTTGGENNAVNMLETKRNDLNGLQFAVSSARPSAPSCSSLTNRAPNGPSMKTEGPVASRSRKSDVEPLNPSYERPVLTQCQLSTEISVPNMSEISLPVENGPVISEEKKKAGPIIEVCQKVGPTRHERKMMKKQSKYEKLVGCWVPPVFEAAQLDADEEVWISRRVETTLNTSSRNDVDTCRESGASLLWQPCASFLVEADMHALPYTVPF